jgi:hypothetical protein
MLKELSLLTSLVFFSSSVLAQENNYLLLINVKGKGKGFVSETGKVIIEPQFDDAEKFSEGLAAVQINGKWGFIDKSGNLVIQPQFTYVKNFSESLALINENRHFGYINAKGQILIEPRYDKAFDFSDGLARVKTGKKWQFIDKTGAVVLDLNYDWVGDFSEGRAVVAKNFSRVAYESDIKVSYIDKSGKPFTDWFTSASEFSEGLAFVSNDSRIIPGFSRSEYGLDFDNITNRTPGKLFKYQAIDSSGKIIFKANFDDVSSFSDGLAQIQINGKIGFVNRQGKIVIEPRFDSSYQFSEGMNYVGIGDKRFFIDKSGKILFEVEYSLINNFNDGIAEIFSCKLLQCGYGYIDKAGRLIASDKK